MARKRYMAEEIIRHQRTIEIENGQGPRNRRSVSQAGDHGTDFFEMVEGFPRNVYDSQHSIRNGEYKMNRKLWMVFSASLLAVLGTWGGYPSSSDAQSSGNHGKAVIIQCVLENTNPDPAGPGPWIIRVFASSSSAGAPVMPNGGECAQAIASVLAAGFQLDNVAITTFGPQYTLIK